MKMKSIIAVAAMFVAATAFGALRAVSHDQFIF